ncbi:PREDICTED: uncharacterized protein LOC104599414 isoform X2 [Nelumbo nucifera]|uniref:Uncharacterized protein LOC104599414 isoform X2 n=1 Tax=Nelumbo nucifera TaxID=4432 RepID=A0A1U8A5R4_NELNU|nr:PREDICTED: uncharacterized protein LOC104599414 isoform X2 [Nelumbo nucifera]
MAFCCRIRQLKLVSLSYQCKKWYFQNRAVSLAHGFTREITNSVLDKQDFFIWDRPSQLYNNVCFFSSRAKKGQQLKKEEKEPDGPRVNEKIDAEFVRLVMDEGHEIVPRHEALERARKLKLDLVEVQRTAKPPVCKLMDFHLEKYKRKLKEKERTKSKSEVTLRTGDCKEIKFSAKTEQRDLQMKADMAKRFMERGYRVKCTATGTEIQDLGGLLSRLSPLIEDISIVESGPIVEKRQAYVIVRHIKFGTSKKGSSKKAADIARAAKIDIEKITTSPLLTNSSQPIQSTLQIKEDWSTTESGLETDEEISADQAEISSDAPMENTVAWSAFNASDDSEGIFDFDDNGNGVSSENLTCGQEGVHSLADNSADILSPKPVGRPVESSVSPTLTTPSPRGENRYLRSEPRRKPQPRKSTEGTASESKLLSEGNHENRGLGATGSIRPRFQFQNQGRMPQTPVSTSPSTGQKLEGADGSQNQRQDQFLHRTPSSTSYGIFSAPKPAAALDKKSSVVGVNFDMERSTADSNSGVPLNPRPPMSKS